MDSTALVSDLIARAQAGDAACFERLVEPLYEPAFRLAAVMLDDRTAAEDAVQDALLTAWRKLTRFRHGDDVRPWLMTLVANRCRELRRRRWRSVLRLGTVEPGGGGDGVERVVVDADLRRSLLTLSLDERLVVVLRYYLDLPFDEVARIAGVSAPAARKRAERALRRLRNELREPGEEE